jgi:hypothetical protein
MKQHDEHVKKYRRTIAMQGLKAFLDLVDVVVSARRSFRLGNSIDGRQTKTAVTAPEAKTFPSVPEINENTTSE